jgi:hypothetical protein
LFSNCTTIPKTAREVPDTHIRIEKWNDKEKEKIKEMTARFTESIADYKEALYKSKITQQRLKTVKKRKEAIRSNLDFLREFDLLLTVKNEISERKKLEQEIRQEEVRLNKSSLKIEYLNRKLSEEELYVELKEVESLFAKSEWEYERAKIANRIQKEENISPKSPDFVDLDEFEEQFAKFKEAKLKKNTQYETAKKYTQELRYESEKEEPEFLEVGPSRDHPSL